MTIVGYLQIRDTRDFVPIFSLLERRNCGTAFTAITTGEMALRLHGQTLYLIVHSVDKTMRFSFLAKCGANTEDLFKNQVAIDVLSEFKIESRR